jgi:hydroxymethylbilane synthase
VPDRLILATRGSRLALTQARLVADLVRGADPSVEVEFRTVRTSGDKDSRPLGAIGGKGLFVAEVEREVADGRADFAVHSAKDLTAELAPGCAIVCVPPRAAVNDVVVGGEGETGEERLQSLPAGAAVGTSSLRRQSLLSEVRSDLRIVDLRGNIDTRLRRVDERVVDAAILAAAGLERIGAATGGELDPFVWVPAPGQGALAVEARADRSDLARLFATFSDPTAFAELECERAFSARLEGGCSVPLGCLARGGDRRLLATGFIGHLGGLQSMRDRISGGIGEAADLGRELADAILAGGGDALLEELKA